MDSFGSYFTSHWILTLRGFSSSCSPERFMLHFITWASPAWEKARARKTKCWRNALSGIFIQCDAAAASDVVWKCHQFSLGFCSCSCFSPLAFLPAKSSGGASLIWVWSLRIWEERKKHATVPDIWCLQGLFRCGVWCQCREISCSSDPVSETRDCNPSKQLLAQQS